MVYWALNISLRVLLLRQFQTVFSTLKVIHGKFMMIKEEFIVLSYVIPACLSLSFCATWERDKPDDWCGCWAPPTSQTEASTGKQKKIICMS